MPINIAALPQGAALWGHLGVVSPAQLLLLPPATYAGQQVTVDTGMGVLRQYFSNGLSWVTAAVNGLLGTPNFGPTFQAGFSVWNANASTSSNSTLQSQWQLPAPFVGLRLAYTNYSLADITLAKSRVAATVNKGANGAALTWVPVTFNGAASVVLPNAVNAPPNEVFTQVVSDLVTLSPADAQNLIYTRSDFAGNFAACDPGIGNTNAWNNHVADDATLLVDPGIGAAGFDALGGTWQWQAGKSAGVVANDTVPINMNTNFRDLAPDSLIVNYAVPTIGVGCCGGSHLRGDTTFGDNMGFVYRACMLKNLQAGGKQIWSPANYSRSGGGSAPALANLQKLDAAGMFPQIMVLLGSSGDDGSLTQAVADAGWNRLVEMLKLCAKNRCRPIVAVQPPVFTYNDAQNAILAAENARTRSLAQFDIGVIDLNLFYRDIVNPNVIYPPWTTLTKIHATNNGQQLNAALALASML